MKFDAFNDLGYGDSFVYAGALKPKLQENGEPFTYSPAKRYVNKSNLKIIEDNGKPLGSEKFCLFNLGNDDNLYDCSTATIDLPKCAGVYLWVIRNVVVYVGRASGKPQNTLYHRFKSGYGRISPRNCYEGGQRTNLRMNRVVVDRWEEGISIYYCCCDTPEIAEEMECKLLDANWETRKQCKPSEDCYTLMYNRHR